MKPDLHLSDHDQHRLDGGEGPAMQFAMKLVTNAARIMKAERLIDVSFAHIDACFYSGRAHLDFVNYLLAHDAKLSVPSWTNTGLVSLVDPSLRKDGTIVREARELMQAYERLGCKPVWTCAPYQLPGRPNLGDHIVGSESNAVTFYNSVIGARTNKYGDFLDVAAALTGRVPDAGLHRDEARRAQLVFSLENIPEFFRREDLFFHLLGHFAGARCGSQVPVFTDLPQSTNEDNLKAISAAVAASGGVALFHAVGITPEAPDLEAACQGMEPDDTIVVTPSDLIAARKSLSRAPDGVVNMVALGTPHFSYTEFEALVPLIAGRHVAANCKLLITTSRHVRDLIAAKGWLEFLEKSGAEIVVDTCSYFSPTLRGMTGRVMTNSAKWAYYAPGMLPIEVTFGSLRECAETAIAGENWRDPALVDAMLGGGS
ncbi:MAG: aconitase X catalytic domain-containing protein [Rhizobiales bacterium]|nr:aconitase X catalytic domain-containing protein [Hyphomicrobiales bacterium]